MSHVCHGGRFSAKHLEICSPDLTDLVRLGFPFFPFSVALLMCSLGTPEGILCDTSGDTKSCVGNKRSGACRASLSGAFLPALQGKEVRGRREGAWKREKRALRPPSTPVAAAGEAAREERRVVVGAIWRSGGNYASRSLQPCPTAGKKVVPGRVRRKGGQVEKEGVAGARLGWAKGLLPREKGV